MRKLIRRIKSKFIATPTRDFTWTVEDFKAAEKWARTQDDPENTSQSLWDACYPSREETSYILAKINNHLRTLSNEKTN
jgi:hypothetical protein|tara:strand:- start:193 stop:429 length:237 start_codon:yes stop_codon:yes gene_type:complete